MIERLLSARSRSIDSSGIRKVFDLGTKMVDPINLSIGQPDFPVSDAMKEAAIAAIRENKNGYTVTQGIPQLLAAVRQRLAHDFGEGWSTTNQDLSAVITSGTSGGILLALMSILDSGDEFISPDPYFVMYPQVGKLHLSRFPNDRGASGTADHRTHQGRVVEQSKQSLRHCFNIQGNRGSCAAVRATWRAAYF